MKTALPWTTRDVALWAEDRIGTEGGLYGWDHRHGAAQPIPGARTQEWLRRRNVYERAQAVLF